MIHSIKAALLCTALLTAATLNLVAKHADAQENGTPTPYWGDEPCVT